MSSDITIRSEQAEDRAAIAQVNRRAFGQENEARLVDAIREEQGFDPALSLVAVRADEVVGHILFSPIQIESDRRIIPALALAPMAVLPDFQRQGIGSALVREGLDACRRLGHAIVIVVGHPEYYPRFGFVPASSYGIMAPFDVSGEAFMVRLLREEVHQDAPDDSNHPGKPNDISGVVRYPSVFDDV